jgi:hypothetical protein
MLRLRRIGQYQGEYQNNENKTKKGRGGGRERTKEQFRIVKGEAPPPAGRREAARGQEKGGVENILCASATPAPHESARTAQPSSSAATVNPLILSLSSSLGLSPALANFSPFPPHGKEGTQRKKEGQDERKTKKKEGEKFKKEGRKKREGRGQDLLRGERA